MIDLEGFLLDRCIPVTETGCWIWLEYLLPTGYGHTKIKGKSCRAHRLSFEIFRGPVPDGMYVCHSCDVRSCVNPDHLWLGTAKQNSIDMVRKGRAPSTLDHLAAVDIFSDTRTQHEIAKEYGISQTCVSNIKTGKRWSAAIQSSSPERST